MSIFGGAARLAPGNSQWSQLANFFPRDSKAGLDVKGWSGLDPSGKGGGPDWAGILAALGSLRQQQPVPEAPPPMQFGAMPGPRFRDLLNAPQLGPRNLMPTPAWMAPYMWGRG